MEQTNRLFKAVIAYGNGNPEAFNIIYEESNKYIYTCIYKVVKGNDNAQDILCDIMQDTYVQISKSIDQLEDANKFLSWAGTIATRKCYEYLKKTKKYVLLNEEDNTFENLSDDDAIIPEEIMQNREKQRLIREIMDKQLTEMQKLCIIAYYYNEQKQSEIAEELGIPENTVKTNLSRAKAKIKEGVLDLEKNKGTKLYSVTPFLLLLFREEVLAAVVPAEVQAKVSITVSEVIANARVSIGTISTTTAVTNASTGATTVGKVASISMKTKLIAIAIGVGTVGVVGTSAAVVNHYIQEASVEDDDRDEHDDRDTEGEDDIIDSEEEETVDDTTTEEETSPEVSVTIRDVLLNPERYPEYYPADIDTSDLWFAVVDFNGNGHKEVLIGTAYNNAYYAPNKIVNVLEIRNGVIVDMDGENVYEMYEDWTLYDTGVLSTTIWNSYGATRIWRLSTGEYWEGTTWMPTEESAYMPAEERETHAELTDMYGNVYELEAGDELFDSLHEGNEISLNWYQVTEENVNIYLSER